MTLTHRRRQLSDVARGGRLARSLARRERWPRARVEQDARRRADDAVRHAVAHSPFYREHLGPHVGHDDVELARLPTLDRATMMERFDDLVTVRDLHRDVLLEHVDRVEGDELWRGRYRVMATSGSSGRRGVFVYDRAGWAGIVAQFLRYSALAGIRPRLPRLKIAALGGGHASHMTRRVADTMAIGVHRVRSLPVTLPLPRLVAELNAFSPDALHAYPSVAALLADEQRAGRLAIAPKIVSTSSERRTPDMTERIRSAFGVRPFDLYGTTEGLWGCSCDRHAGIHLFDDMTLVENVDADGRPVRAGERGDRLLVTNLFNRVQPLIRLELADAVTLDPEPCACGRSLPRVQTMEGRSEEVLELRGAGGRTVPVHPLTFDVVPSDVAVREFQVVQRGPSDLRLRLVLHGGADDVAAAERVRARVADRLAELGLGEATVEAECCGALARSAAGKLKLVVAEAATEGAVPTPGERPRAG